MKLAFRLFMAALAASMLFSSNPDETAAENCNDFHISGSTRVITVSFGMSTRTIVGEDLKPEFIDGDRILVSNGKDAPEECIVNVSGGAASISTSLSGDLKAVYPCNAAVLDGNEITGVEVRAVQNGAFEEASLTMATLGEGETEMEFESRIAMLIITPPAGVKQFTVTSLRTIGCEGHRTGTAAAINTDGEDSDAMHVVTVGDGTEDLGTCYVALSAGVKLSDLSFDTGSAIKGLPMKSITTNTTCAGDSYTINCENWHPYVTIGGKKWATMNLGATSASDYGEYFAWGSTTGYKQDGGHDFSISTTPFFDSASAAHFFNKYTDSSKTTLDLNDDAAYANWGGIWRMPTRAEFEALISSEDKSWGVSPAGFTFGSSSESIFFPAAGFGEKTSLFSPDDFGFYWSSSLDARNPGNAFRLLFFQETNVFARNGSRCCGQTVRAIVGDEATAPSEHLLPEDGIIRDNRTCLLYTQSGNYWYSDAFAYDWTSGSNKGGSSLSILIN